MANKSLITYLFRKDIAKILQNYLYVNKAFGKK
ncbi:hypothetical protein NPD5_3925 [Clostridium sporogenes]|uniref:Uncharacterized protein n=1 Tax=Clostridium sporogenes TaxID=1509 RepID=A0A1L3NC53_CLOSG|nr:hypothetical protein T259_4287 [Clostridium botulinum CDC_1436]APH13686.1 hypothetical protein NPD5_3925 [Clostridium sporogenes]